MNRINSEPRKQEPPAFPPLLVSVDDAAQALSVSRSFLYELMARGDLPWVKCGKRRLITAEGLREFASRLSPGPEAA